MSDFYQKIMNTLMVTGAKTKEQRQQVYDKARKRAQADMKRAESTDEAVAMAQAVEDAIKKIEAEMQAKETSQPPPQPPEIVDTDSIRHKEKLAKALKAGVVLLVVAVLALAGYTWYDSQQKLKAAEALAAKMASQQTRSGEKIQLGSASKKAASKSAERETHQAETTSESPDKAVKSSPPPEPVPEKATATSRTAPEAAPETTIIDTDPGHLSYEEIRSCATQYLEIDSQWKKLDKLAVQMDKQERALTRLEKQGAHHLAIMSEQSKFNNLVNQHNILVDHINTRTERLNNSCSGKSADQEDINLVCQKGSPYWDSTFCKNFR